VRKRKSRGVRRHPISLPDPEKGLTRQMTSTRILTNVLSVLVGFTSGYFETLTLMHPPEAIAQYARGQRVTVVLCTLPVPAEAASRVSSRMIQVVEAFKLKAGGFIPSHTYLPVTSWLVSVISCTN
jgi:hypothetical protein